MPGEVVIRRFNPRKDGESALAVFQEVGWREGKDKKQDQVWLSFLKTGRTVVAALEGRVESLAQAMPGTLRYLEEELSFCAVTAVVTGRLARQQGFASRATARLLAEAAAEGALVAGLGIFDQGFYNRLGFGGGSYEHWITLDPARLQVERIHRLPRRLTMDDWQAVHKSRLSRMPWQGSINILPPVHSQAEMLSSKDGFGLGYFQGRELTHHLWISSEGEFGPYSVYWMTYRSHEQFLELMSLIRGFADQVHVVKMREPPGIQIQDLVEQPFRQRRITRELRNEYCVRASAYWQMRILNLEACIRKWPASTVNLEFNLELRDPLESYLEQDAEWRGIGGQYVLKLGPQSEIEKGGQEGLPTLSAGVGAFTRLWLGVQSASGLAVTDELSAPAELLEALDRAIRLPSPKPDWDF